MPSELALDRALEALQMRLKRLIELDLADRRADGAQAETVLVEQRLELRDLQVRQIEDGLLVSLTDDASFGMFAVGSAEPQAKLIKIMEKIAAILKTRQGQVIIRGHTDGRAYKSFAYDNWRLSSERAQMARYMLVRGGLDEKRFEAVEGYADRRLKLPNDPSAAENRRIEILLRFEKS